MLGLRQKMLIGFMGLFLISAIIGAISIIQITDLGGAIGSIMKENYRSVRASQEMKESIERMDDGIVLIILGDKAGGRKLIAENREAFTKALDIELGNITLPGEHESALGIQRLFEKYEKTLVWLTDGGGTKHEMIRVYSGDLLPLASEIRGMADRVLTMNQQNMYDSGENARRKAAHSRSVMIGFLIAGAALTCVYVLLVGRWILKPVTVLSASVDEIRKGNLDLVIKSSAKDEIGRLSEAFNEMTESLRDFRRSDEAKMIRLKQSVQQTFESLPFIVALLDGGGTVEMSTKPARDILGLTKGVNINELGLEWMKEIIRTAPDGNGKKVFPKGINVIQHFDKAREYYFQPMAAPILDNFKQPTGTILIINDVTGRIEHDEMKTGLISAVSHQLKTPLTSLRMALYILLDEKTGALTAKQTDLLLTAREESDRLNDIIENLLNISRLESGKTALKIERVSSGYLILDAAKRFRSAARDKGIDLVTDVPDDLPDVLADASQIDHVYANLISNSLKYTPSGGNITLHAEELFEHVLFTVSDTGIGIPEKYAGNVFERFFRVPEGQPQPGTGLGLAIVKEIVEAHGGEIRLESIEGKGCVFSFSLPIARNASPAGKV
jgi:signal transduction histidine kinase/HAMP domain-containing protein